LKKNEYILKSVIEECKKHLSRMNYAYQKVFSLSPFTEERITKLGDEDITYIDQLIYRFTKLQDVIGQKLFKAVLLTLEEEVRDKSAIDIFNRLEQLGFVKDYEMWQELRELRNELSHEYEEDSKETAEKINSLLKRKPDLEVYFKLIVELLNKKNIL